MPRFAILFLVVLLAGCSTLRFPGVYRIDIPQGNFVTEDMLAELNPGMTRQQVRFVLGPPTLDDPFTTNSWYYLLNYRPGDGDPVSQEIIVHFDGEQYSHYEGEPVPDLQAKTTGRQDRELQEKVREGEDRIEETEPGPTPGTQPAPPQEPQQPAPSPTGGTSPAPTPGY